MISVCERTAHKSRGSELSIECDRMMALSLRDAIYLFDVCLFAIFVCRVSEVFVLRSQAAAPPKNHSPLARNGGSQICNENPAELSFAVS